MLRKAVDSVLETPFGYQINQLIAKPTTTRFGNLIKKFLPREPSRQVLDVGCAIANYTDLIAGESAERYTGIDINSDYLAVAQNRFPAAEFRTMDATDLGFPDSQFDDSLSIATSHHFDDDQLAAMVSEALRVVKNTGRFYLFDAILPLYGFKAFKTAFFRLDRGRYARELSHLRSVVETRGEIESCEIVKGPLHDVCLLTIKEPGQY
jgi:SAM-dependent methyltransferase